MRFLPMYIVSVMVLGANVVFGQHYPNKPIRLVASDAGGAGDITARVIGQSIADVLGQPMVIDNRAAYAAQESVAKAAPDGYTLFLGGSSFIVGPLIQPRPWDPVRDFAPISMTDSSPNVLVVHPSLAVKSVKELIAVAKAQPGKLNYAGSGVGGSPHLAGELFKNMAGVDIVRVPFKGGGPAIIGLASGEVQMMFPVGGSAKPLVQSGKLIALAVTTRRPSVIFPGVPTVADSGLPGYEVVNTMSLFAPAKTPAAIINRLNRVTVMVLGRADIKERYLTMGIEATPSSPQQLSEFIKSETTKWGKLIKEAGIRAE